MSVKATQSELEYYAEDCRADVIITDLKHNDRVQSIQGVPKIIIGAENTNGGNGNFEIKTKDEVDSDCLVVYTSGTTGKPKGVMHTLGSV